MTMLFFFQRKTGRLSPEILS